GIEFRDMGANNQSMPLPLGLPGCGGFFAPLFFESLEGSWLCVTHPGTHSLLGIFVRIWPKEFCGGERFNSRNCGMGGAKGFNDCHFVDVAIPITVRSWRDWTLRSSTGGIEQ